MALIRALRFWVGRGQEFFNRRVLRPPQPGPEAIARPVLPDAERAAYFRALAEGQDEKDFVDDRTWADLELGQVFSRLDKSLTPLGTQYLYATLRQFRTDPNSARTNLDSCNLLRSRPALMEALRRALRNARGQECAQVAALLIGRPPVVPARHRLFYAVSALALVCPVGLFFSPWFLPVCLAFWVLCIVLHSFYRHEALAHAPALSGLASVLGCAPQLMRALEGSGLTEAEELASLAPACQKVRKQISKTLLGQEATNDLALVAIEYLNLLCLFELCSVCRALVAVNRERSTLLQLFRLVARLDARLGLASALSDFPVTCTAELSPDAGFKFVDVYHPLLESPVANSIESRGNSLLFTGTNMAGKTTFIKTLALNALLAQSIGFCLARKAVLPAVRLRTMMNREDKVAAGQSYFFFEATQLLRLQDAADGQGDQVWFVLDELFRGTNTIERVAAAKAVLAHLAGKGLVIATTHDTQLTSLLAPQFQSFHFSEVVDAKGARFDYQLREGPCLTRNAIKLLALAGYPQEVIDAAQQLSAAQKEV